MTRYRLLLLALVYLSLVSFTKIPRPVPAAGVVEREIEKEFTTDDRSSKNDLPPVKIDIPEERLVFPEGKKVMVRSVRFKGNECFSTESLIDSTYNFINCEMSIEDIYNLCSVIDNYYAQAGYFLTRVYPPPQDICDGCLELEVIEGRLGEIHVEGNCFYSTEFIVSYFEHLQGRPLNYNEFLRALLLLNENPDLFAGAIFVKGHQFGTGDLILRVTDGYPAHLYLNGNNYGRLLTTNVRGGARLDWGSFFFEGDQFSICEVVGFPIDALYFTDLVYRTPMDRYGVTWQGEYLSSRFKIEEFRKLDIHGRSDIGTLRVNQAFVRNRYSSVDLFAYFDYKQIQNFVMCNRTTFDKLRVLTCGLEWDDFGPCRGRSDLVIQAGAGLPNFLGGLKVHDHHSSRKGAGGRFFVFNLDYDYIQGLPWNTFLYFHASGQYSPNRLTLPELLYIGGDGTVRGFPLAVGLGDSGYYINWEYRFPMPFLAEQEFPWGNCLWKDVLQFDAFLDGGAAYLHGKHKKTHLWGTGGGLRLFGPAGSCFSIDVGVPLNDRKLTREVFVYMKLTAQPF